MKWLAGLLVGLALLCDVGLGRAQESIQEALPPMCVPQAPEYCFWTPECSRLIDKREQLERAGYLVVAEFSEREYGLLCVVISYDQTEYPLVTE